MKMNRKAEESGLDLQVRAQPTLRTGRIKTLVSCGLLLFGLTGFAQKSNYIGQ